MSEITEFKIREQKRPEKKIHVAVCLTHTFDYMCTAFTDFMLAMRTKYSLTVLRNNMLPIERNRGHLVNLALADTAVTHCLFLDTDIVPNDLNFLDIMVSYDIPIVGLLCTKRIAPYEPILIKMDAPKDQVLNGFWVHHPKGLVEVDATGTGCLLVKREVFEAMEQPYFVFYNNYRKGIYQSEDVYFLEKSKKYGYKVYVDTKHTCKHYGPYGFGIDDFYAEMKKRDDAMKAASEKEMGGTKW